MPYTQRRRFVNDKYLAMKKSAAADAGPAGAAGARKRVR